MLRLALRNLLWGEDPCCLQLVSTTPPSSPAQGRLTGGALCLSHSSILSIGSSFSSSRSHLTSCLLRQVRLDATMGHCSPTIMLSQDTSMSFAALATVSTCVHVCFLTCFLSVPPGRYVQGCVRFPQCPSQPPAPSPQSQWPKCWSCSLCSHFPNGFPLLYLLLSSQPTWKANTLVRPTFRDEETETERHSVTYSKSRSGS